MPLSRPIALDLASTASLVTVRDGEVRVQDGPFVESREQIGGYVIIDVRDEDEARQWASRCPPARTWGDSRSGAAFATGSEY